MPISKLLIFLGQLLKTEEFISARDLQHYIATETTQGGYQIPLAEVENILMIMEIAGFLESLSGIYTLTKKEYVKKEVASGKFDTATNPLYASSFGASE